MAVGLIAGVVFLKVDGQQYQLRGNFKVQPNNLQNTGIPGQDSVHGFMQKPVVPYVEGEISDSGGLSLQQIQGLTDSTVTAELQNGKTYILQNAWYSGDTVLDTVEGKIPVKFEGMACQELLAA